MPRKRSKKSSVRGGGGGRVAGGRGRGRGRGRGPGPGRGPGMPQISVPPHRIHTLQHHLVMHAFDYLDEPGRKAAFTSVGWQIPDYTKHREALRKKISEYQRKTLEAIEMKAEREEWKRSVFKHVIAAEGVKVDRERWCHDVFKHVVEAEATYFAQRELFKKSVFASVINAEATKAKGAKEEDFIEEKGDGENCEKEEVPVATSDDEVVEDEDTTEGAGEPKAKESGEGETIENNGQVDPKEENTADERANVDGTETETKDDDDYESRFNDSAALTEAGGNGEETTGANNKVVEMKAPEEIIPDDWVPRMSGRLDPNTLLARLNTRCLHRRLVYYRKKFRDEELEKKEKEKEAGESQFSNPEGSMIKFFESELKKKAQEERMHPKNLTVDEISEQEWEDLMELARMRLRGEPPPYDPIPTQYELLQFTPCPRAVAVLASYPRSGNSLMRTLYERTTKRVTGSDMQGGLAAHDLVGEMAVTTNMVQFVKTHFPERRGSPAFPASRVVLLVRNPYDAIDSYFNLMMTGQHTKSVSEEVRKKTTQIWERAARRELRVWIKFHEFWLTQDVPLLMVRYEDLVRKPDKVMERVLQFVLELRSVGSFFGERIDRCIREQEDIERMGSYKPRSGGIGKSMSRYTPEMLRDFKGADGFKRAMVDLGYRDLLSKPVEQWADIEPLPGYGIELLPSYEVRHFQDGQGNQNPTIAINKGELSRGQNEFTPWGLIKKQLTGINSSGTCNCDKCKAAKAKKLDEAAKPAELACPTAATTK